MPEPLILPNGFLAIAEENLRAGQSVRLRADGSSMYPFIRGADDSVEILPLKPYEEPQRWYAYLCRWNDKYIIHRLIGKQDDEYIFSGDGNTGSRERVGRHEIIGILSHIHRDNGKDIGCLSPGWARKGKVWHTFMPVRRYLLGIHRRLVRYGIIR